MGKNPLYKHLKTNLKKPVVLVGMMGTGKSALARTLARKMDEEAIDIDAVIVKRAGLSIPEIFEKHGETTFRKLEKETLAEVLLQAEQDGATPVIATGGGLLTSPECAALVQEKAISVWLKADLDHLAQRLSNDKNRPMLSGAEDVKGRLEALMAAREALYAASNITFVTHELPLYKTVPKLAQVILSYLKAHPAKNT